MQLTIGIMLLTTVLQGMLPSFHCCGEGWGWFGLVALILLRMLQGLSVGGELPTASVYITEVSQRSRLGVNLSWISLTGVFGAWSVASFVVFLFQTALTKEQMLLWGWRLPYLLTIIPGALVIMARWRLKETPAFEDLIQAKAGDRQANGCLEEARSEETASGNKGPQDLWANYKLAMLVGSLGTATFGVTSFVPPMYGAQFIQQDSGLPANVVTFSEMMNYAIPALLAPAVGLLVDWWGAGRVYTLSALLGGPVVTPLILYWWAHVSSGQAILSMFVGQALLGLCLALQTSVFVWVVELFPVHVRVAGVSMAYNIGVGVCGGLGPLISDAGNRVISNQGPISAPAAYTAFFGIVSLLACLVSRVLAKRGLMRVTHIRDAPY
jgi:MHS family proline/betaine transporter-like MFS transporter